MATSYALRAASKLYASLSAPSSRLWLRSSGSSSRGISRTHPSTDSSTSKLSPKKSALGEEAPEKHLSDSAASRNTSPRQRASGARTSSRKLVSNLGSRPTPKATPAEPQYPPRPKSRPLPTPAEYKLHRERMKKKFPEGWAPPRTISREAMEVLRALHAEDPVRYRTPVLANKFKISPEAVSRILKSKWRPSPGRTAQLIARDNVNKDKWIAGKIRTERAEVAKSLQGRLDIVERAQGKDKLTLK